MKKSSLLVVLIVIAAIVAMFKMESIMGGLGFVLAIIIVIYVICCFLGALYLLYEAFHSGRDIIRAIGYILGAIAIIILGFKVGAWLIGVLW